MGNICKIMQYLFYMYSFERHLTQSSVEWCKFSQKQCWTLPDELVIVEEGCVFDQTQAFLHSVDKRLDLQVCHFVQGEEADSSKHIQQVTWLEVQRLYVLE